MTGFTHFSIDCVEPTFTLLSSHLPPSTEAPTQNESRNKKMGSSIPVVSVIDTSFLLASYVGLNSVSFFFLFRANVLN